MLFYWFLKFVAIGPVVKLVFRPHVEGVENVHLTAPAADVAVGSTELPMLGTVTLSELTEA